MSLLPPRSRSPSCTVVPAGRRRARRTPPCRPARTDPFGRSRGREPCYRLPSCGNAERQTRPLRSFRSSSADGCAEKICPPAPQGKPPPSTDLTTTLTTNIGNPPAFEDDAALALQAAPTKDPAHRGCPRDTHVSHAFPPLTPAAPAHRQHPARPGRGKTTGHPFRNLGHPPERHHRTPWPPHASLDPRVPSASQANSRVLASHPRPSRSSP